MPKQIVFAVDDEPRVTRVIQVNLERAGYEVQTANDSVAALEALETGQITPNLIILDVTMPYLDGFEMLRALKANPTLCDIPVILLSARSHNEDILHGSELGAAQYLLKPLAPTELITIVNATLAAK
jgi:DNA-binding response OmpR family regulator